MSELITPLDASEKRQWRRLQTKITEGVESLWELVEALQQVRDARLYRDDFGTFEKYVDSIGMDKRYVNMQIRACEVRKSLGTMVPKTEVEKITTERQLRELTNVPEEKLAEVVERAAVKASDAGKPITAKILKESVKEAQSNGKPRKPAEASKPAEDPNASKKAAKKLLADYLARSMRAIDDYNELNPNRAHGPMIAGIQKLIGMVWEVK